MTSGVFHGDGHSTIYPSLPHKGLSLEIQAIHGMCSSQFPVLITLYHRDSICSVVSISAGSKQLGQYTTMHNGGETISSESFYVGVQDIVLIGYSAKVKFALCRTKGKLSNFDRDNIWEIIPKMCP
jgi:hypothetical protein